MKTTFLLSVLFAAGLACAQAQETPGAPMQSGSTLLQTPDLLLLAPVPPSPPSLPQPAVSPAPVVEPAATPAPALAAVPPKALEKGTAEELRQAIRIRELRTLLEEDPEVQAWKTQAQCMKTEAGRCIAMRNYYTLLYTKMEKLDPSLFAVLETELHWALWRYEQHFVRPTVLIEPIVALPGSCSEDHAATLKSDSNPAIRRKQRALGM